MKAERQPTLRLLDLGFDARADDSTSKHILIHMARKGNKSGCCWLSIGKLASAANAFSSTVERSLRRLVHDGWISDVSSEYLARSTKTYRLNLCG